MYHVEDFDDFRDRLTPRAAVVAAAVLPALPDDECLVRVCDRDRYDRPQETAVFRRRCPTIAGTRLRRVEFDEPSQKPNCFDMTPSPHAIRSYTLSRGDVDMFYIGTDPDFDDTDQTALSDFGVTPSPIDDVHRGVSRTDDAFDRQPIVPA
jgi:hypothetical protein